MSTAFERTYESPEVAARLALRLIEESGYGTPTTNRYTPQFGPEMVAVLARSVLAVVAVCDDAADEWADKCAPGVPMLWSTDVRAAVAAGTAPSEPPACEDCGEHHEGYGECPAAPLEPGGEQ